MNERPMGWNFWSKLNPNLTFKMLSIILFLTLIAIGNTFSVYDNVLKQDKTTAFFSFLAVIFYIIPAYGLFKLKSWARKFELVFSFFLIVLGVIILLFESFIGGLFIIVTHGLIALYLLSKECKDIIEAKN